jgi:putative lipoic acid-binding regulatory protein
LSEPDASPYTFPVEIPFRVMGRNEADFPALVLELVGRHVAGLSETALSSRPSSGGNYVSITVTCRVESRAQLDAIFRALSSHARVLMVL